MMKQHALWLEMISNMVLNNHSIDHNEKDSVKLAIHTPGHISENKHLKDASRWLTVLLNEFRVLAFSVAI